MTIETVSQRQNLTIEEQRSIYRAALEKEIVVAIGDLVAPKRFRGDEPGMERVMAGYYAALLQVQADADDVPDEIIDTALRDNWSEEERDLVGKMLAAFGIPDEARAPAGEAALREIGAPITDSTIREARANLLRGMMEAHKRAELFNHPLIAAGGDRFAALLDDELVLEVRRAQMAQASPPLTSTAAPAGNGIYLNPSTERFSEIIFPTLRALKSKHKWKDDLRQRTAIAERFAWVTGNKPLCEYTDADIEAYVEALRLMPTDMRYGRLGESGHMALPYDPSKLPEVTAENRRDERSINRDLSTLHSMATQLAKGPWRSRFGKDVIEMDFKEHMIAIEDDPADPKRMPWTPEHLRVMFSLPLWNGSGGALARLKTGTRPQIYHDAAYWVPLFAIYTGMSREEICGLEVIDFVFDCEVPFLLVRANMTRSQDGVTPGGLKRKSRHRVMPIHPELLRLGLEDYVERIATEAGYSGPEQIIPIFPELYRDDAKRESRVPKEELVAPELGGNARVLVLAPKRLRENWTLWTQNDVRNMLVGDRFAFDVLNHTDLSREQGQSGEMDLSHINWGNYDLVVIDESHNFRNRPAGKGERETRYDKLLNAVVKAGVKTKVLMLSATPVNNRLNDLKNQIAFATEANDQALAGHGVPSIAGTVRIAQGQFNRWQELPEALAQEPEIDLIIATDCISEGQNLQDCDCVVNYDIHWNPVRIVQRFGRVDRLGSPNRVIQLVNFWPNMDLDSYIGLQRSVSGKMMLLDVSATGEENLIETQAGDAMNDLEYRRRQLESLQERVIDLEDLSSGVSITDLTLNDLRLDLARLSPEERDTIARRMIGTYSPIPASDDFPAGALFLLRAATPNAERALAKGDPLYPHALIYIGEDERVILPPSQPKRMLDLLRLASNTPADVQAKAWEQFDAETREGSRMDRYQSMLAAAIRGVTGKAEERAVESLFTTGGVEGAGGESGLDDWEVITWLAILPPR